MGRVDLKKIYLKEIKKIIKALKPYKPEKIILFGSAAQKRANRLSDIDLLIIKRTKRPFLERNIEAHRFIYNSYGLKIPTDVFVLTPREIKRGIAGKEPFVIDVITEGKVVYER